MRREKSIQKLLIIIILIIFCLEHLSILSIAHELNEFSLESTKYLIAEENEQISRIIPETTIEEFKENFNVEKSKLHVYKSGTEKKEVTSGYIATGMILTCDEIEESYTLSVIGDITKEGTLNQIDLNLLIKHIVGMQKAQLKGIEAISADLSGDRKIDQVDITILIRYIVYHELYVPEIVRPAEPIIEVIGNQEVEDWYNSDVTVKIRENSNSKIKIGKTIYKIATNGTIKKQGEIQTNKEQIVELSDEGEYKITAYSYSEEGAKSNNSSKNIKIDKTAPSLDIVVQSNNNTINVNANGVDNLSGIKSYTYSIGKKDKSGNIVWENTEETTQNSHSFSNLEKEITYYIKVIAKDKAGNIVEKQAQATINSIPALYDDKKAKEESDRTGEDIKPNVTIDRSDAGKEWTNEDVIIKVEVTPETDPEGKYDLEYSIDGGKTWKPYEPEKGIIVEENTDVQVRLTDGKESGEELTIEVKNIDKKAPTIELQTSSSSNTIHVKVNGEDDLSGIKDYTYYLGIKDENGEISWESGITISEDQYEFTKLEQETEYFIKVEAQDKAGNKTQKQTSAKTQKVPTLYDEEKAEKEGTEPNITISRSDDGKEWTNQDVVIKVEISPETDPEGKYDLEYSIDGGKTWEPYDPEKGIIVEENTDVEVRLTDGENHGEGVKIPVNNIDKVAPTLTITTNVTTSTITIEAEAQDNESGIQKYIYYIGKEDEEGNIIWQEGIETEEANYTFTHLKHDTDYHVKVEVQDKAGNKTSKETKVHTDKVIDLYDEDKAKEESDKTGEDIKPNVIINKSDNGKEWTNQDVIIKVEISPETDPEGKFDLEYSTDGGKTWEIYDPEKGIIVEENTDVEVRATDGTNHGEGINIPVNNIDKKAPQAVLNVEPTKTSIEVNVTATDEGSGIQKYVYYIGIKQEDGTIQWQEGIEKEEASHLFENLQNNTAYEIKVEIIDKAGNKATVQKQVITTEDIISSNYITMTQNNKNWTKENVIINITSNTTEYETEFSLDGKEWEEFIGSKQIEMSQNGTVYTRVKQGENKGDIISLTISNIDKTVPQVNVGTPETTSKSFMIGMDITDNSSGLAQIKWYYKNENAENYIERIQDYQTINGKEAGETNTHKSLTIDGLTNGVYKVYAVIVDVAGNKTIVGKNGSEGGNPEGEEIPPTEQIEIELPKIDDDEEAGEIILTPNTTNWTNNPVKVTVNGVSDKYETQISLDESTWENKKEIDVTQNGSVYARLTDGVNYGTTKQIEISNIDTSKAVVAIENKETTTKSFTINANIEDTGSGLGKIDWYIRKTGEISYQKQTTEYQTIGGTVAGELVANKEITFENLTSGTYEVYAEVTDVAGNTTTTTTIEVTLATIQNGANGIDITSSNEKWTNENITITATPKDDNNTVQTSSDSENWQDETTITYEQNGNFYARLTDGINVGNAVVKQITNIDKTPAEVQVTNAGVTTKSFAQKIDVTDNASGLSKIQIYYRKQAEEFAVKEFEYQEIHGNTSGEKQTSKNLTVEGLTAGTYEVYVVVTDVAGNETVVTDIDSITLETVTAGQTAITLLPSTTNWTNEAVNITAETELSYQIQMKADEEDWKTQNSINVTENKTIYARLFDGINAGETTSITINNIDTTKPTGQVQCTEKSSKSMNIKVTAEDSASGIAQITWYYQKIGETWQNETENYQTIKGNTAGENAVEKEKLISGLENGNYNVYAVITDVAGNSTTTEQIQVVLEDIPEGSSAITLTPEVTYWTNSNVKVTASTSYPNYVIETSKDRTNWRSDTIITVTENQAVYARLSDTINSGRETSYEVTNIDKTAPTAENISVTITEDSIDLSLQANDDLSGIAQVIWYYKEENQSSYQSKTTSYIPVNGNTKGELAKTVTETLTDLSSGIGYKIYAVVYDVAGNIVETDEIEAYIPVARINDVYYKTLQNAIDSVLANNNQTIITILKDITENVTISSNKNILLDLNNKTLKNKTTSAIILNAEGATLTAIGGIIQAEDTNAIVNNGTTQIEETVQIINTVSEDHPTIFNQKNGTLKITGGSIQSEKNGAVYNKGTLEVTGGAIEGYSAIVNEGTATVGGTVQLFNNEQEYVTISNRNGASLTITGGTIEAKNSNVIRNEAEGTINITGGNLSSQGSNAISNFGTIQISGTAKVTNSEGLNTPTIANIGSADLTIKGGSVQTENHIAIYNTAESTLTITGGNIQSKTSGGVYNEGILGITGGTVEGINAIVNEGSANVGGTVQLLNKGQNYAIISNRNNATLTLTGGTLVANSSNVIKNEAGGTVNIKGGNLRSDINTISNYGRMEISGTAQITNDGALNTPAIANNSGASLTITGGTIKSENHMAIYNAKGSTVEITGGNIQSKYNTVNNSGTMKVGGTAQITNDGIKVGSQETYPNIYNQNGATLTVEGGTITSENSSAIHNCSGATLRISGGNIRAKKSGEYGVYNDGSSNVTITGGTISSKYGC